MTLTDLIKKGFCKLYGSHVRIDVFPANSRNDGAMGRSDDKMNVIGLCETMPQHNQEETLLHEIIHLIHLKNGIEMTEQQVCTIAVGIHSFLKQNEIC